MTFRYAILVNERNRMTDNGLIHIERAIYSISTTITKAETECALTIYGRQIDMSGIQE